jgi:L-alanine-DL-glutamate epimerase-like enolase superfamily enzyme
MAPFDAALHDAWGAAWGGPLYAGYTADWLNQDLGAYLGPGFRGRYPGDYLAPRRRRLAVQHVVNIGDALTPAEVDPDRLLPAGLPADLTSWIRRDRVRHFKLKTRGRSPVEDARRLVDVYTAAVPALAESGVPDGPRLSVDPNEGCRDPEVLSEILDRVQAEAPQVLAALDYIEQPTARDLAAYTYTLHAVARRVPVIIDESLDTLDHLERLHELGWSGLAVKTCKGHTHSLLAYCWGRHHGLYLTVQDLTNPGLALVHSANFCAHLHLAVDCFECNHRQFLPLARPDEKAANPDYFRVADGYLTLPATMGPGLY